ncbi:hypothetical protein Ade02nite_16180 [Paractinoplanes deccanensis]|uniref:Anti-sigma factor antagonist n=1 Tax=Paractinoplanes deccanensis TaxID=113561 RepID=A0ABQ3XZ25_9ACTN|nr:STAS domain-containing protein [Actinoplanes deccanensis]GID72977.1 hypothetical protein Ade02nite_16180 [Actinoplanes deccanensis]
MTILAESGADAVVAVAGEIDMDNAGQMQRFLIGLLHDQRPGRVVLDMGEVTFLGSAGIHALVTSQLEADGLGARLEVRDVQPPVRQVMDICGVADMLGLPV